MRPTTLTFQAASANSICQAQTIGAAGALVLSGSAYQLQGTFGSGAWFPGMQAPVSIISAGNLAGVNFTVTGFDSLMNPLSDTLAGPNNGTVTTPDEFMLVTGVSANGAVGTNVTVGNAGTGHTQWWKPDRRPTPSQFGIAVALYSLGALTYTVQYTNDEPGAPPTGGLFIFNDQTLVNQAASGETLAQGPVRAARLAVTASNGGASAAVTFLPAGP